MKEKTTTDVQKRFPALIRSLKAGEQVAVVSRGKLEGHYRPGSASRKPDRACVQTERGNLTREKTERLIEDICRG